jgi:site-specific recombinase XerD
MDGQVRVATMSATDDFAELTRGFFLEWLPGRKVSGNTVSSYRDALKILVEWACGHLGVEPTGVTMDHLTAANVLEFMSWLEAGRGNAPSTVNNRLAAIKSFCKYASWRAPQRLAQLREIQEIPGREAGVPAIEYLTPEEAEWVVDACEPGSERQLMVQLLYNTGARVSEALGVRGRDVSTLESGRLRVRLNGKGRKQRELPLWEDTSRLLADHMERRAVGADDHVFPGSDRGHLTRFGARDRVKAAVRAAAESHPQLAGRTITPHTFRHSTAMAMLASGMDIATVAIWLGHESVETTHKYVVSDMSLKEAALDKVRRGWEAEGGGRYVPSDDVLAFLRSL